jgi:hypothetical protein
MKYLWCLVVLLCPIVAGADKPRHNRLCWLSQKCADLKAREIEYLSPVTLTPMALEIDHRDLPNRITTSLTPGRTETDLAGPSVSQPRLRGHLPDDSRTER